MGKVKKSKPAKTLGALSKTRAETGKSKSTTNAVTPLVESDYPSATATATCATAASLATSPAVTRSSSNKRSRKGSSKLSTSKLSSSSSSSSGSSKSVSLLAEDSNQNASSRKSKTKKKSQQSSRKKSLSRSLENSDADQNENSTLLKASDSEFSMSVDEDQEEDLELLGLHSQKNKSVNTKDKDNNPTSLFLLDGSEELIELDRTPPRPSFQRKCSPIQIQGTAGTSRSSRTITQLSATNLNLNLNSDSSNKNQVSSDGGQSQNSDSFNSLPVSSPATPVGLSSPSFAQDQHQKGASDESSLSASPTHWNLTKRPNFQLSEKLALHFEYLGHREEEITTTTKPAEKRYVLKCKLCLPKRPPISGHETSTSNFNRHLSTLHGIGVAVVDSSPDMEGNTYYPRNHPKQKLYELNCVRHTVMNNLSFEMSRWDAFQMLVQDLDPCIRTLSGATMRRRMNDCSLKATEDLRHFFSKIPFVSLVVDGWSTKKNKGVIAVMAIFVTDDFTWGVKTLRLTELSGRHTGTALRDCMDEILIDFGLENKVTSIVIDNGSNMVAAFDSAPKPKAAFCHEIPRPIGTKHVAYRCAAHTLQLIVKNSKLGHLGISVRKAMVNVMKIMNSHVLRRLLLLQTGRGFPKKSETRWNAEFDIIYLLISPNMFNAVNHIINYAINRGSFFKKSELKPHVLSEFDHQNLMDYCALLGPLAEATDKLQADGITASSILPTLLETYQKLRAVEVRRPSSKSVDVRAVVLDQFVTRFSSWFSDPILVAATFLDPYRKLYFFEYMRLNEYDHELPLMSEPDVISKIEEFCFATTTHFFGVNTVNMEMDEVSTPGNSNSSPVTVSIPQSKSKKGNLSGYACMETGTEVETTSPNNDSNECESGSPVGPWSSPITPPRLSALSAAKDFEKMIALEIRVYLLEQVTDEDIVSYWKRRAGSFPMLATLFRVIMSRPATTAAVERLFSKCGIMTRDRRSNIVPETINKVLITREWFEETDILRPKKIVSDSDCKSSSSSSVSSPRSSKGSKSQAKAKAKKNSAESTESVSEGFDIDDQTITQLSPTQKSPSPLIRTLTPESENEFLDFETALAMVLDGSLEDDEDSDIEIEDWESTESQAMGWE